MKTRSSLLLTFLVLCLIPGCWVFRTSRSERLPGWQSPVSDLFVDQADLPEGWQTDYPGETALDPEVNHAGRSWGRVGIAGSVGQAIWRAPTVKRAEPKYAELRKSQFHPSRTLSPYTTFLEFQPPDEIDFHSTVADEFYMACGWWRFAYCEVIARYRNYVVELRLDREAEHQGDVNYGLTYPEIEAAVRGMDAKFANAMAEWYPETP